MIPKQNGNNRRNLLPANISCILELKYHLHTQIHVCGCTPACTHAHAQTHTCMHTSTHTISNESLLVLAST